MAQQIFSRPRIDSQREKISHPISELTTDSSKDRTRSVGSRLRAGGFEFPHGGGEGGDLRLGGTGFAVASGEDGVEKLAGETKSRIVGETLNEVVTVDFPGA